MGWIFGDNTAPDESVKKNVLYGSGCILLPTPEKKVWFDVEGIDDWSVVGNSWFDIGTPLLERLRSRREELELNERIRLTKQVIRDCARSMLHYRRRKKAHKRIQQRIDQSIPTFVAAHKQSKEIVRHFVFPNALQVIVGLLMTMMIFQASILVHSMWTEHNEASLAYLVQDLTQIN